MSTEKFESTVMNIPASAWASGVAAEAYKVRARFVYNKGLALQMERKEKGENRHGYAALCKILTDWRHAEENSFLAEAPTHALQQSLKDLDRAFVNLYAGRTGPPRFKKRGRRDAFRFPDAKQIRLDEKNSRIFLPKLGWIRYRKSREVAGVIKQVTVSRSVDAWHVSIQTEQEVDVPTPRRAEVVGIDVGVARFATLSDGTTYMPASAYRKSEKKLAKEQRKLARKQKYSANWRKHVRKVQKLHKFISDKRRDLQHKISTAICKKHALVVIEDLNVKGMSASASGTVDNPGTHVRAKAGLNKAIRDQGWSEFRRQLEYKLAWTGGTLIVVPARYTSARCAVCGHTCGENRKSQAKFACMRCGNIANADHNAAQNILAAGLAVIACGEKLMGISMKQEPTVSAMLIA